MKQESYPELQKIKQNLEKGKSLGFVVHEDGTLAIQESHMCARNKGLRKQILEEAPNTRYTVHPGGTKMYRYSRKYFWRNNMKKKVAECVDKYLTCQKVKAEHQHPVGKL